MQEGLFAVSAALCLAFAWVIVRGVGARTGAAGPALFMVGVLAAAAHMAGISLLTSLVGLWEPWTFLAVQGVLLAVAAVLARRRPDQEPHVRPEAGEPPQRPDRRDPVLLALRILILLLVALSAARQWVMPISGWDERMYQASRVGYWLHHRSILWYETHNERQVSFPFGGELFFAWPVLFTKSELVGKMVFWLGFPLSVILVGLVCRSMGLSKRAAQVGALLYAATPAVLDLGTSLKSDTWSPVFLLCGMGLLLGWPRRGADDVDAPSAPTGWRVFFAGFAAALAVNVKTTLAAAVPGMALLAIATFRPRHFVQRSGLFAAGLIAGVLISGLGATLIQNYSHNSDPKDTARGRLQLSSALGSPRMIEVHRSELSYDLAKVHLARIPFVLAELPEVPSEVLRQRIEKFGRELAAKSGADTLLPLEKNAGWPGSFQYHLRSSATRYGLGGLLWIPALIAAALVALFQVLRYGAIRWPAAQMLLAAGPLFLGIVLLVRWMGGGPERFWIGAYALAVPMAVMLLAGPCRRWSWARAFALILVGWTAAASIRAEAGKLDWAVRSPPTPAQLAEPFAAALPHLPPGSKILLVAGHNTRDYWLFRPHEGFSNSVVSWAVRPWSAETLEGLLEKHQPTHVLLERADIIGWFHAGLRTEPVANHMRQRPDYREIPLNDPVVLFERIPPGAELPELPPLAPPPEQAP